MLTEEQLEIRALAREFAAAELRPHAERWDEQRGLDDGVIGTLAESGFLGLRVPEAHGGLGVDNTTLAVALVEVAWGEAAVGLLAAVHNGPVVELLVRHGSEAQKSRFLPALASGELVGAFARTESGAGGDLDRLETVAEARDDGGWTLRGAKRWVPHGERAGVIVTFARTSSGVSAFLLTPEDGYTVKGAERTMGLRASETVSIELDVQVGPEALLGEEGRGLEYAHEAGVVARLGVAAASVGIARAALEHAVRYAGEREQFGHSIAQFGAIQEKLARMAVAVEGAQALVFDVARRMDANDSSDILGVEAASSAAKVAASEAAMMVSDEAVQIFGGYGYMRDYPVEKLMRDAKGTEIYQGTTQVLSALIAKDLMTAAGAGEA